MNNARIVQAMIGLHSARQEPGEAVISYFLRVQRLAATAYPDQPQLQNDITVAILKIGLNNAIKNSVRSCGTVRQALNTALIVEAGLLRRNRRPWPPVINNHLLNYELHGAGLASGASAVRVQVDPIPDSTGPQRRETPPHHFESVE